KVTNGKVFSLSDSEKLLTAIGNIPDPPATLRRFQLWAHPMTIALMISGLTAFWIGRKWVGLI
ncbi:MAG TPA: hypothetical protein VM260_06550, partial [Pirellula sp.]|nr:hypothetical protein [Pirellula sp.]